MKKKLTAIVLSIVCFTTFFSCEESIHWHLSAKKNDLIVVDGILTNENKQHKISISRTLSGLYEPPEPVENAIVSVYDGDKYYYFSEMGDTSGAYFSVDTFRAVVGRTYTVHIYVNSKYYTGQTQMVPVTPFDDLIYKKANDIDTLYQIDWDKTSYDSDEAAMWHINVFWPDSTSCPIANCQARIAFYTIHSIDISQIFSPVKEEILFPQGTVIVQKKFSLNDEYSEYIRSLLLETEWRGSPFDIIPANLNTNLSEGAIGFFTACTVISDTVIVKDIDDNYKIPSQTK